MTKIRQISSKIVKRAQNRPKLVVKAIFERFFDSQALKNTLLYHFLQKII
jgi:hypothetical protein